jgi:hypothetical protein
MAAGPNAFLTELASFGLRRRVRRVRVGCDLLNLQTSSDRAFHDSYCSALHLSLPHQILPHPLFLTLAPANTTHDPVRRSTPVPTLVVFPKVEHAHIGSSTSPFRSVSVWARSRIGRGARMCMCGEGRLSEDGIPRICSDPWRIESAASGGGSVDV